METMEITDPESQMTALTDEAPAEGEEQLLDELEDLSNSLREAVQDGAVKPKLHCLMMDPAVSMVTVQSEDSGIVWETASSRCSTPWASEFSAPVSQPAFRLCAPGSAGRIVFIMDEELLSRRKRKQRAEKPKALPQPSLEILAGAERPAMVEVSMPNPTDTEAHETADVKEEKHQQLFSLVSEGSEILNIIAPPKVSTVDEEESRGLEDHLHYLEETPGARSAPIPDEPEPEKTEEERPVIPDPPVPLPCIPAPQRGATEDYFEKFTLLDHQTPSGAAPGEESQPEKQLEATEAEEVKTLRSELELLPGISEAVSMLDISGEHLDDVFYGGGSEPPEHDPAQSAGHTPLSKAALKESGSALFGSEESVLTPIYLPEGPQKIIDLNLLEEPKALAFQYSDLYADAVGTRKKPDDDVESITSEKSFHSQQSDSEDRGYLEKFVLKVEAVEKPEMRREERTEAFGVTRYMENRKEELEHQGDEEEITDFFRNSASSSPCDPLDFERLEKDEEPEVVRTPRVTFKEPPLKKEKQADQPPADDTEDFSEEFLPVEISEDCPAWEENLPAVRAAVKQTASRTEETKHTPKSVSDKSASTPTQAPSTPTVPQHRAFLDLSVLMPIPNEDEGEPASCEISDGEVKDAPDPTLLLDTPLNTDTDHAPGAPSPSD